MVVKKPEVNEIVNYLTREKNYDDFTAMGFAEKFWHFYESKGWVVGKSPMKSWKSAIRTWELKQKENERNSAKATSSGLKSAFIKFYSQK